MSKKKIEIEKALRWAYRDELPKQPDGSNTTWDRYFQQGCRVDETERLDEPGFLANLGAPHPDALLLDYFVRSALTTVVADWPRLRIVLMRELACWTPEDDLLCRGLRVSARALVESHAMMGTRPTWDVGPIRVKRVLGSNHKPVVNGITAGRRYAFGACCPLRLDPGPLEIASARFEYHVWREALAFLAESCRLEEHELLPPVAAPLPWVEDTEPKLRVIKGITPAWPLYERGRARRKRPLAESCPIEASSQR